MEATISINSNTPAYVTTRDDEAQAIYVSTIGPDRTKVAVDRELIVDCAGESPDQRSLVVFDKQESGGICGIEILNAINIEQAEKDGAYSIEMTVGTVQDTEQLVTVENGISFDGPSWDTYPGLETDFTQDGQLVAIRVEQTDLIALNN